MTIDSIIRWVAGLFHLGNYTSTGDSEYVTLDFSSSDSYDEQTEKLKFFMRSQLDTQENHNET